MDTQFSFDEINNYLNEINSNSINETSGLPLNYASSDTSNLSSSLSNTFQRLTKPTKSFREDIMEKLNSKLLRSPSNQDKRCSSPSTNTLKNKFRFRKKSSSSENSCQNETNSITSTVSLNSSLNLDLKKSTSSTTALSNVSAINNKNSANIDADPVFNGLASEDDVLIENKVFNAPNNDRDVDNAWNFVKQLTNALRYLQDVVEKDILEQLSGAASVLLEIVVSGYAKLRAHLLINEKSELFVLAKNKMCSSLAELCKWSDVVLLYGEGSLDRNNVCAIVNSVKDAVESLVKLCVDKHQRQIKQHSSSNDANAELNDQIEKLNLDHSFANIQYRSKPLIRPISTADTIDKLSVNFPNDCLSNGDLNNEYKMKLFTNSVENQIPNKNLANQTEIDHQPDLINNQNCQSFNMHLIKPVLTTTAQSINGSKDQLIGGALPESTNGGLQNNELNFKGSTYTNSLQSNKIDKSNLMQTIQPPKLPFKNEPPTTNYCNVAQIVETSKCNQMSIESNLVPPRLPPKKQQVNRKINFNQLSDLKFNDKLNEKLSQHLNEQLNQHLNDQNNQFNRNQLNCQLPKSALVVPSNSILNNRARASEHLKFRSQSLNCTSNQSTAKDAQRKHHSDNEAIKDFLKINKNLNEITSPNRGRTSKSNDMQTINSLASTNHTDHLNNQSNSHLNNQIDGCQIVFRNKKQFSQQSSYVQLSEEQFNQFLNEQNAKNLQISKVNESSSGQECKQQIFKSNDIDKRPSSQYDNLSLNEFSDQTNQAINNFSSNTVQSSTCSNQQFILPTPNSTSSTTVPAQASLNSNWNLNNFSTANTISTMSTVSSSNSSHFDGTNSNRSSNRSSKYSNDQKTASNQNLDCESQSSYENNEEELPPPIPPKQNKNISVYCQLFSSYTAPKESTRYRYSVHTVHEIYKSQATYQQVELSFNQQKEFHNLNNQINRLNNHHLNRHRLTASSITTSSDDSMFSIDSFNSDSSKETNLLPLPPKKSTVNCLTIPEKPEAYRYKNQLPAKFSCDQSLNTKFQHHSYQFNEQGLNEIKTAKHFDTLDFTSRPDSLISLQKSESGISSTQSISKSLDESTNEQNSILDELDVQKYLIYKKEPVLPIKETPKKGNKKGQVLSDELKEELQGAPVDALIVLATVSNIRKKDFLFLEAFLTTYRTFVTPYDLISKLIHRFNKFIRLSEEKQMLAKNSFALLVRVVDDLCVTDCTNELMETLFAFFYSLIIGGDLVLAKVLRNKVLEKVKAKRSSDLVQTAQKPLSCLSISTKQCSLLDFKSYQLAEQMTLFDNELFVKIEAAELLLWSREQIEEPNLNKFTEHFNKMSYWARSRIIEENEPKEREKIAWKFIKIMKHLRKMNNFNSYLALLSALDSAPIRRLDWPKSITETFNEFSNLIDPSSSFRIYRQILEETEPPSIPYIGLILQDLTFVHIGNKDMLPDERSVNFDKRWQIFNILDQLRKFKHSQYNFKRNEQILNLFNNFDNFLSEESVWQLSLQLKPKKTPKKT